LPVLKDKKTLSLNGMEQARAANTNPGKQSSNNGKSEMVLLGKRGKSRGTISKVYYLPSTRIWKPELR